MKNVLLKGWVTRKQIGSQENSDRYTAHWEALDAAQRCSVFTLFEGVSVYVIPVTSATRDFCRQMGIHPMKCKSTQSTMNPEESATQHETHYFAFLSQVRQSFSKKQSYQNPEVLCPAKEMPRKSIGLPDYDQDSEEKPKQPSANLIKPSDKFGLQMPVNTAAENNKMPYNDNKAMSQFGAKSGKDFE